MKRTRLMSFFVGLFWAIAVAPVLGAGFDPRIAVADRASGTITVIDTDTDTATTVAMPGPSPSEPMYVVYSPIRDRVFVGDRANGRVVVFRGRDFSVETTVPTGDGVFHMWASLISRQLWVNNDVDNTITVIDTRSLNVLATVPAPADLVADGGRLHDVVLDPVAKFAYVTMLGFPGPNDFVVKYSTRTFQEVARQAVGKDPHVSATWRNSLLYVPCQNSNEVVVLNRRNLNPRPSIPIPGAHGAGMALLGDRFYTTNLPGGGTDGLFAISTRTNAVLGSTDTPFPVPHNVALIPNGRKIYVTHSGATADKVSVYTVGFFNPVPRLLTTVTTGNNPFGLAFVP